MDILSGYAIALAWQALRFHITNNYWHTNYRASQGGYFRFRYVVTSAAETDPPSLSRMGWLESTPMENDQIRSQDKALDLPRSLDGKQESFVSDNAPDIVLDTWKPAEDSNGTILRLIDLGGNARDVKFEVPLLSLDHVVMTDAVERDLMEIKLDGPHDFTVSVTPHQILTLRLVTGSEKSAMQ